MVYWRQTKDDVARRRSEVSAGGGKRQRMEYQKFKQRWSLARIDHPSIAGCLIRDRCRWKPYIVMQYSMAAVCERDHSGGNGILAGGQYHRQIGRALSAAHERAYFIAISNRKHQLQSLGGGEEQVKIIDFGIAKVKTSLVSTTRPETGRRNIATCRPSR